MQQRSACIACGQCPVDKSPTWRNDHVTIRVDVVDLHKTKVRRLQRVERAVATLSFVPNSAALTKRCCLFVNFSHSMLERLLQVLRIIDFKDQLPRRSRQDGTVNSERTLSTEWYCDIVANIETVSCLLFIEILSQFR